MNILIAEDEMISRRLLEKFLTDVGHTVESVSNGVEAWESFSRKQVRVIVSDWRMPDMDGLELCRKVRAAQGEDYTYFILLSSVTRTVDNFMQAARAGLEWGVYESINNTNCAASTTFNTTGAGSLDNFNIQVDCAPSTHFEGATPIITYQLTSSAETGVYGTLDYVFRRIEATVSIQPP